MALDGRTDRRTDAVSQESLNGISPKLSGGIPMSASICIPILVKIYPAVLEIWRAADGPTNGRTGRPTDGRTDQPTDRPNDGWHGLGIKTGGISISSGFYKPNLLKIRQRVLETYGVRRMDSRSDGRTDGQTDGQTDRPTDRRMYGMGSVMLFPVKTGSIICSQTSKYISRYHLLSSPSKCIYTSRNLEGKGGKSFIETKHQDRRADC